MNITSVQSAEAVQTASRATQAAAQATATAPAGQTYYFSPTLKIDPKSQKVVLEYLNSHTGAVLSQYPSEKALAAYAQTGQQGQTAATDRSKGTVVNPFDVTAASQNTTATSSIIA